MTSSFTFVFARASVNIKIYYKDGGWECVLIGLKSNYYNLVSNENFPRRTSFILKKKTFEGCWCYVSENFWEVFHEFPRNKWLFYELLNSQILVRLLDIGFGKFMKVSHCWFVPCLVVGQQLFFLSKYHLKTLYYCSKKTETLMELL